MKKRTCHLEEFAMAVDHRKKIKESEKIEILGLCLRAEKTVKHEGDGDTNHSLNPWNGPQRRRKESRETGDERKIQTIQTTALLKSDWILRRVLKNWSCYSDSVKKQNKHQSELRWKTHFLGFGNTNGSPNPGQTNKNLILINKKQEKNNRHQVDFCCSIRLQSERVKSWTNTKTLLESWGIWQ